MKFSTVICRLASAGDWIWQLDASRLCGGEGGGVVTAWLIGACQTTSQVVNRSRYDGKYFDLYTELIQAFMNLCEVEGFGGSGTLEPSP